MYWELKPKKFSVAEGVGKDTAKSEFKLAHARGFVSQTGALEVENGCAQLLSMD